MLDYESKLWENGVGFVAGVDEVGRGPLAGPVTAAAVVFAPGKTVNGVDDSKKLTPLKRERLSREIISSAVSCGLGSVWPRDIDRINILNATYLAMRKAIGSLGVIPEHILVDGSPLPDKIFAQTAIVGGDGVSASIAAASIIAKVARDRIMCDMAKVFPEYGFERHKGYGTSEHIDAIKRFGATPLHRLSFRRVKGNERRLNYGNRKELGEYGEQCAAIELAKNGYSILEKNFRYGREGEIDLIAAKDDTVVFVEVKTARSGAFGGAELKVDVRKQAQIGKVAAHYLKDAELPADEYRFDVIAVKIQKNFENINHLKNAFWLTEGAAQ